VTRVPARLARAVAAVLLVAALPGCVYYNTLYLAKRYYVRSFDDVPYALDKEDVSSTPQFLRAIDLSKKVVAQYPKSKYVDEARLLWAKSLIGNDDPRQAIPMLEDFRAKETKGSSAGEGQFYLGVAYARARKYEAALRTFDAYLADHPKHDMASYAYYERSRVLLALDRPGDAAQSAGEVVEKFPRSRLALRARVARADALVAQRSFDAARADYRWLGDHSLTDDDRFAYLLREADCLEGAQKYDEAMALLRNAIAHEREPARQDTSATGGRFVNNFSVGPGGDRYGRLLMRMGTVHLRSGRMDDALGAYRRVLEDYPRTQLGAEAQYRLGYAYETGADDFDKARIEYAKVKEQGQGSAYTDQAAQRMASLERIAQYRKAAGGDSLGRAAEADFLVAEQYLFQNDKPDKALEQYRKIEHDYSGTSWQAKALIAQGWVLARKLDRKAAADSLFWKVVREHPATESQLAARDYLEADGQTVPQELIKLPEPPKPTAADSARADSSAAAARAAAAAAAADTLQLSPIPSGTIPLGAPPGAVVSDSLRIGPHSRPSPIGDAPPAHVPPHTGTATDSTRTGTPAPVDTTRRVAPRPAPADTTRRVAPPPPPAAPVDSTASPRR